ncbi:hypothetical protein I302_104070 [Kwoniella bestiolae CBS 10118]|uniref:Uncharacterized protein n=1 Tax=Kwoniella bestiolae CBS 10118 TaxID=1296100 RepID=A0A1B9GA75_9TREE|nr:hypothetical protein I302_02775 [Kwoniella bestiolae CBS 10118]OCF27925.1 hypothetical protein I302_02775 [Kwoniella bestiolae CBS 10118]
MWACFPCVVLWKWGRNRLSKTDPEHEPLFPAPSTILTAPTKKQRPNLSNLHSSSHSSSLPGLFNSEPASPTKSTGYGYFGEGKRNGSASKLSEEGRERLGSISRAYGGRMQPLNPLPPSIPSTPSLPSTPHQTQNGHSHSHVPTIRPLSALTPLQQQQTKSSPTSPYRPSVPNLGRSSSEPRDLSEMGLGLGMEQFAPHQIPGFGSITVGRGGSRGRKRSATTSAARLAPPLALDVHEERGGRRGRSPGPALYAQDGFDPSGTGLTQGIEEVEREERYIPVGRSLSHPELTFVAANEPNPNQEEGTGFGSKTGTASEEVVAKRELGLRGLNSHGHRGGERGRGRRAGAKRIRSD